MSDPWRPGGADGFTSEIPAVQGIGLGTVSIFRVYVQVLGAVAAGFSYGVWAWLMSIILESNGLGA